MLKRVIVVALLAGAAGAWYAALPPHAQALLTVSGAPAPPVRGAIHVHSRRSDGTGDVEAIAGAAARAGLDFVIMTDHGDATREPDPPQYREGVLCIDAVEISTEQGHVVALGLPLAPYPLGGEARDVIEDISRLGGFSIAAHPGSKNPGLQWSDWDAPLGGLEWLNADSEWRDEPVWSLARALFTYPIRSTETLVSLLDRPTVTMERWDELTQRRRVVAVAGSDAHARVGLRSIGEPYGSGSSLHVPSYERMFQLFSNTLPNTTFGGDAATDAQAVLDAIRAGHVYSAVDGLGSPAVMSFTATSGTRSAVAGDVLPLDGPVTLRADVQAPDAARIELVKDGALLQTTVGTMLQQEVDVAAAVYRVEIALPGNPGEPPVPWIVSNPIYVGRGTADTGPLDTRAPASQFAVQYGGRPGHRVGGRNQPGVARGARRGAGGGRHPVVTSLRAGRNGGLQPIRRVCHAGRIDGRRIRPADVHGVGEPSDADVSATTRVGGGSGGALASVCIPRSHTARSHCVLRRHDVPWRHLAPAAKPVRRPIHPVCPRHREHAARRKGDPLDGRREVREMNRTCESQ